MNNNYASDVGAPMKPIGGPLSVPYSMTGRNLVSFIPIEGVAVTLCCVQAVLLVAFFIRLVGPLVLLKADILMWEETDFINNMIKLNIGVPLYTLPDDSNSMVYNPLAFLVTYAIAWSTGLTKSVAGLRIIQLGFACFAAFVATACCRELRSLAFPGHEDRHRALWTVLIFFAMFLAATTPEANKFVYTLHVDSLALLVSVVSFWSMLRYAKDRTLMNLLFMAALPAIGFLTKQILISWIVVMFTFLLLLEPKNIKRLAAFLVLSGGLAVIAFLICYSLWGDNFVFWTVEVMGGKRKSLILSADGSSLSILRCIDHIIRAWPEIFVGVIGAWFLLRWGKVAKVGPLVAAWVVLIASEGVSSGSHWNVLYHFGPGVLIGAVLMFAALPQIWSKVAPKNGSIYRSSRVWINAVVLNASAIAIFMAWEAVPTRDTESPRYLRGISDFKDVDRYVAEIESEFDGTKVEKVLLGVGSWVYLRDDFLQKDRAVSLADQPIGDIYKNFDITVERIRNRTYEKILVQDFHSPYFLYDWGSWPRPSGFRDALTENYTEVKLIEPPKGSPILPLQIMNAGPVSVFVARN